jgi:hypothetical protein
MTPHLSLSARNEWQPGYAIAADSTPGELEYDRALSAAKNLDAEIAAVLAAA